jgi:hypothetical protein
MDIKTKSDFFFLPHISTEQTFISQGPVENQRTLPVKQTNASQ